MEKVEKVKNFLYANYKLVFAISIVLIIFILYNYIILQNYRKHINGMYRATNEFLEVSKLDNILLYINDDKGYIVINEGDTMIYNDAITYSDNLFSPFKFITLNDIDKINLKIRIPEMNDEWKTDKSYYDVKFSSVNNTMEIYSNDTIFAILQREPQFNDEKNENNVEANDCINITISDSEKLSTP